MRKIIFRFLFQCKSLPLADIAIHKIKMRSHTHTHTTYYLTEAVTALSAYAIRIRASFVFNPYNYSQSICYVVYFFVPFCHSTHLVWMFVHIYACRCVFSYYIWHFLLFFLNNKKILHFIQLLCLIFCYFCWLYELGSGHFCTQLFVLLF